MYQEALPKIQELLESFVAQEGNEDLFLVDVRINVGDRVEIFMDSDEGLSLGRCQKISRFIESHLDENKWLDYRAFIKCIFAKTYKEAIIDFEKCKVKIGNSYIMDHT